MSKSKIKYRCTKVKAENLADYYLKITEDCIGMGDKRAFEGCVAKAKQMAILEYLALSEGKNEFYA